MGGCKWLELLELRRGREDEYPPGASTCARPAGDRLARNTHALRRPGPAATTLPWDTLPGGPRQKTITYQAPWVRCNREHDYEVVWKHFEERFGKQGKPS